VHHKGCRQGKNTLQETALLSFSRKDDREKLSKEWKAPHFFHSVREIYKRKFKENYLIRRLHRDTPREK